MENILNYGLYNVNIYLNAYIKNKQKHTITINWCDSGNNALASLIEASASFNCPNFKYNSTTSNHICSCSNQTNFGPGLGWNPLIEDATSDKACSTRAAALPEFPAGEPSKIHKK